MLIQFETFTKKCLESNGEIDRASVTAMTWSGPVYEVLVLFFGSNQVLDISITLIQWRYVPFSLVRQRKAWGSSDD